MNFLDLPHMYVPELFKDKLCNLQIVPRPGQSCIGPTRVIFSDTNEQRYKTSNCTFLGLLLFGKRLFLKWRHNYVTLINTFPSITTQLDIIYFSEEATTPQNSLYSLHQDCDANNFERISWFWQQQDGLITSML